MSHKISLYAEDCWTLIDIIKKNKTKVSIFGSIFGQKLLLQIKAIIFQILMFKSNIEVAKTSIEHLMLLPKCV